MKNKLLSRKFLISLAAFIGSIGTSIAGLHSDNQTIVVIGLFCSIFAAAIYTGCEAWVDAEASTTKNIQINENVSHETLKEN